MVEKAKIYLKRRWNTYSLKVKRICIVIFLIIPLFVCFISDNKIIDLSIFKDLGCALAIISSLFSFTLSWLTDSKNFLSQIYEIEEAKKLYDNANIKSLELIDAWKKSFVFSISLIIVGYTLQHLTKNAFNNEAVIILTSMLLSISLVITATTIYFILDFFSLAKEILKFRNDLEQLIIEDKLVKDIPPFQ